MAETKIPIILSTGMAGKKELDDAFTYEFKLKCLENICEVKKIHVTT